MRTAILKYDISDTRHQISVLNALQINKIVNKDVKIHRIYIFSHFGAKNCSFHFKIVKISKHIG